MTRTFASNEVVRHFLSFLVNHVAYVYSQVIPNASDEPGPTGGLSEASSPSPDASLASTSASAAVPSRRETSISHRPLYHPVNAPVVNAISARYLEYGFWWTHFCPPPAFCLPTPTPRQLQGVRQLKPFSSIPALTHQMRQYLKVFPFGVLAAADTPVSIYCLDAIVVSRSSPSLSSTFITVPNLVERLRFPLLTKFCTFSISGYHPLALEWPQN